MFTMSIFKIIEMEYWEHIIMGLKVGLKKDTMFAFCMVFCATLLHNFCGGGGKLN